MKMIDISSAKVASAIVHRIGNRGRDEGYTLSSTAMPKNKAVYDLLLRHYLSTITKTTEYFEFFHESDLSLNALHSFSGKIFSDPSSFVANSQNIAKHLYSTSTHPNISGGELIVILFSDIISEEYKCNALGLFRIEQKDDYLDVDEKGGNLQLKERSGISLEKIQKGAVILGGCGQVFAFDSLSQKTKYWVENFLKVSPCRTPKTCAKIAGTILKAVSNQISDPLDRLSFNQKLQENLEKSDNFSIKEIREISQNYVSEETYSGIVNALQNKSGFPISDELTLDKKSFERKTKEVMRRTSIFEGVELVITSTTSQVKNIDIQTHAQGIRATIDIVTEKK